VRVFAGPVETSRWLVRAMTCGATRDARHFGARFLRRCAELLVRVPVGFLERGGELVHPARDAVAIAGCRIGSVARCWVDASDMSLLAILEIESERHHRGLVRHERAGRLPAVGVSLLFAPEPLTRDLGPLVDYLDVPGVLSLDLVGKPAGRGCQVLRSIS
jgi:hypothetical protein